MQEWIDRWCNAQLARGLSPNTELRRRRTLERFAENHDLTNTSHVEIEAWLARLIVSPDTRGLYLSDLRAFYKWAVRQDLLEVDPTAKVDPPRKTKYTPRPIPKKQLQMAIAAAPERQRMMLTLAGYAGLRACEIASLVYEDIDVAGETIRVKGKGNKVRIVPLHPYVTELLQPGQKGPVVSWRGKAVGPNSVSAALAKYLRGSGVNATGHQARHTFGTEMYRESRDLAAVQETMGHASPTTTRGYVAFSPGVASRAVKAMD